MSTVEAAGRAPSYTAGSVYLLLSGRGDMYLSLTTHRDLSEVKPSKAPTSMVSMLFPLIYLFPQTQNRQKSMDRRQATCENGYNDEPSGCTPLCNVILSNAPVSSATFQWMETHRPQARTFGTNHCHNESKHLQNAY